MTVASRIVEHPSHTNEHPIRLIAVTGGPCAGKSSMIDELRHHRELADHTLLFIPEAASMMMNHGFLLEHNDAFQRAICAFQLAHESVAIDYARTLDGPVAIICDRGIIDNSVYMDDATFSDILGDHGMGKDDILDRYDAVIHMTSVVIDHPERYGDETNEARYESAESALRSEFATRDAWSGHKRRYIIDGADSFEDKQRAFLDILEEILTSDS